MRRAASALQLAGTVGLVGAVGLWSWRTAALVASLCCLTVGLAMERD